MIRFLFRFVGLWLLAGAFVTLVIDGTRSVSASKFVAASVRDIWMLVDPMSLANLQKQAAGSTADAAVAILLNLPFFVLLSAIGLLCLLLGRRRNRSTIGYSSRD